MMKTFAVSMLVVISIKFIQCFLTYPFTADQFLQPFLESLGTVDDEIETNLMKYAIAGEQCMRECKKNDIKVCHFNFTLKHYQVMGASCRECSSGNIDDCIHDRCITGDGVQRGYLAVNFKLPGPKIDVCKNDIIVVDLFNDAEGLSTTLHWHGMRQVRTQFMDGVPYLTQCPIPFGESFRYSFHASDEGTHFYHAHAGHQKVNGVYGALVVRGNEKDNPNADTYDFDLPEHVIVMSDWMHENAEDYVPGLIKRSILSHSILINGRGRNLDNTTKTTKFAPISVFHVEKDSRYRFRVINAGVNVCAFTMQVEDHPFKIIATEVSYVKPETVDTLHFMSGERFDFVIDTNGHEIRDYFIRFKQLDPCIQRVQGFAILRYHPKRNGGLKYNVVFDNRTVPDYLDKYPEERTLNDPYATKGNLPLTGLQDFRIDPKLTDGAADKSKFIFFDTPGVPNNFVYNEKMLKKLVFTSNENGLTFIGTANNISFVYPNFPLLLETDRINDEMFCDEDSLPKDECDQILEYTICRCIHRIKFELNSIAELVIVNIGDKIAHPMHLHGHKFHVVETGMLEKDMTIDDVKRAISKRSVKNPPYKDTVILPFPGFVRLRFRADNPGFWLFHCHLDWHLPIGMALMIQVGEVDQMRKPPADFPRCLNYMPNEIV